MLSPFKRTLTFFQTNRNIFETSLVEGDKPKVDECMHIFLVISSSDITMEM